MPILPRYISVLLLLFLFLFMMPLGTLSLGIDIGIGIGIGIGEPAPSPEECPECSQPPPPSCPPPPPPPSQSFLPELLRVFENIREFNKTITCDPMGVTKTWTLRPEDICADPGAKFKGFYCEVPPNKTVLTVAAVDFNGFGICSKGVGRFIANFTDLAVFHANSNNFSGPIPAAIAKLPFLYELDLSNNKFSGNFPTTLLAAKKFRFLDLRFNAFSGTAPAAAFSSFPILDVFFINNNRFSMPLPDSLGRTPAEYITLANNLFTGAIPSSIGDAGNRLKEILLLGNRLSGCLPYEIGNLHLATVFDASENLLVGTIPYSFACLSKVEQLNLAENRLRGAIPEALCGGALSKLLNFNLSRNYFTELGPKCLQLVKKKVLDVRRNCIPGMPEQRPAGECALFLCRPVQCPRPSTYRMLTCTLPRSATALLPASSSSLGESYRAVHHRNR